MPHAIADKGARIAAPPPSPPLLQRRAPRRPFSQLSMPSAADRLSLTIEVINGLQAELKGKDDVINGLQTQVREKDAIINDKDAIIDSLQAQLAASGSSANDSAPKMASDHDNATTCDMSTCACATCEYHKQLLARVMHAEEAELRAQSVALHARIEQQRAQMDRQRAQMDQQSAQEAALRDQLEKKDAMKEELRARCVALRAQLEELKAAKDATENQE
ncbi:uncharacterized protein J3D65DRAFT_679326 [Phyllosticta citribraziliensis]|uniref:Uncharacterized protein n=1 Tax=Phyllosticta citribraziliensis TaxID=989973 RepID=A0ABR1LC30_9PEZI